MATPYTASNQELSAGLLALADALNDIANVVENVAKGARLGTVERDLIPARLRIDEVHALFRRRAHMEQG